MTRNRELEKIVGLDRRALTQWIKTRLSGLPGSLPPQISRGEDPEDLIVALHRSRSGEFKERISGIAIDLLREQVASVTPELNLPLLSRLVFLADALEITSAAPLLISFLFRKELHGKNTPHGDLQELILRCLLGLNPSQFDSRFWALHFEDPKFVAVAIRGLAVTDPPAAVRSLPRLFQLATSGIIETDAKLVLWRVSSGWNHREFLSLLVESMKGSDAATRSGINAAVEELPFEAASKELFKMTTRPGPKVARSAVPLEDNGLEPLSLPSTSDIGLASIFQAGHGDIFYIAAEQEIAAAQPIATRGMGYPELREPTALLQGSLIFIDATPFKGKEDFRWPERSGQSTQMSFPGFLDQGLSSSTFKFFVCEEQYGVEAGGHDTILTRAAELHPPDRKPFTMWAGINVPARQGFSPVFKKNTYVSADLSGIDVIKTRTGFFTRKGSKVSLLGSYSVEP